MTVRVTPASSCSREARPGLSWSVRSLRQAPQWSAERRARLRRRAPRRKMRPWLDAPLGAPLPSFVVRLFLGLGGWQAWARARPRERLLLPVILRRGSQRASKDDGPSAVACILAELVMADHFVGPVGGRLRMRDSVCAAGMNLFVRPRAVKRSGGGDRPKDGGGGMRRLSERCGRRPTHHPSLAAQAADGPPPAVAGRDEARENWETDAEKTAEGKIEPARPVLEAPDTGRGKSATGSRVRCDQAPLRGIAAAVARVRTRLLPAAQTMRRRGRSLCEARLAADAAGSAAARLRGGEARRPAAAAAGDAS